MRRSQKNEKKKKKSQEINIVSSDDQRMYINSRPHHVASFHSPCQTIVPRVFFFFFSVVKSDVSAPLPQNSSPLSRVLVDRCFINQFNHPFDLRPRAVNLSIVIELSPTRLSNQRWPPNEGRRVERRITFSRTFISDVHSTLAGNGTDCGRWDHRAAGASCSPPVRPSCTPSSRPDCTPRSDLRTMAETLHVTTVRSLSRDRRGGIGKACRIPRKSIVLSTLGGGDTRTTRCFLHAARNRDPTSCVSA